MDAGKREARQLARLQNNAQVQRLFDLFGLSLSEAMNPKFGADHIFDLSVYGADGQPVQQQLPPTLEYLSQDLGLASASGYEEYGSLALPKKARDRLLKGALQDGKDKLERYLSELRPLLMGKGVYLYTVSLADVETSLTTGQFVKKGKRRVLCALPMTTQDAERMGCTKERTKEIAPQVAWLIPMLVLYRKIKMTEELIAALDGWKALLDHPKYTQIYITAKGYAPCIMNRKAEQLLLL